MCVCVSECGVCAVCVCAPMPRLFIPPGFHTPQDIYSAPQAVPIAVQKQSETALSLGGRLDPSAQLQPDPVLYRVDQVDPEATILEVPIYLRDAHNQIIRVYIYMEDRGKVRNIYRGERERELGLRSGRVHRTSEPVLRRSGQPRGRPMPVSAERFRQTPVPRDHEEQLVEPPGVLVSCGRSSKHSRHHHPRMPHLPRMSQAVHTGRRHHHHVPRHRSNRASTSCSTQRALSAPPANRRGASELQRGRWRAPRLPLGSKLQEGTRASTRSRP